MLAARRNCSKRLRGTKVSAVYLDVCVVLSQNSVFTLGAEEGTVRVLEPGGAKRAKKCCNIVKWKSGPYY